MRFADFMPWRRKGKSVYDRWVELLELGVQAKSGQAVTLTTAMRVSAAFACMSVLSRGCAQTPFKLYREQVDASGLTRIRPARDHQVYDLVAAKPNSWQTPFAFRETAVLHACLGNAYAFKGMYRGKPAELILLNPARVRPEQKEDWSIVYHVSGTDGTGQVLDQGQIGHLRGPSWDGFMGLDTLQLARESLGLSLALEESHARLHANGVRPSGTYSVEGALEPEQHAKLTAWLKKNAAAENAGTPLVLDRSATWLSTAMTGVDAQHKEVRDHQITEVCRFFGVLPIMIGHTGDKANTYASAEAMFTAHKVHTLDPWFTRIQESADLNLLTDEERKAGYYFKFNANGLLRGSAKDRADYYAKALGSGGSQGWMTPDEVRALEELDPLGGDAALLPKPTNVQKPPAKGDADPEPTP
jgi:HK97 family phage portal protein